MYVFVPCPRDGCSRKHGVIAVPRANPKRVSPLRVSAGAPDASSATPGSPRSGVAATS